MAIVYRALDLRLRRQVAVKALPPDLAFREDVRMRFLREAETAARLNHPNIVPIYSVDERGGVVFFVMALVDGENLGARLARGVPLPVGEARRVLGEVADALAYAHARGVIHRDIKPDNILLERQTGRPMVTDFGIARAVEADSRLTVTGITVGTPAYMSPEQALGEREIDGRSDIYSLGVVGYQMLAGEPPFRAANTPSMMMKHVSETPRPLRERRSEIPRAGGAGMHRALAKRPDDRWADAGAFRDAITGSGDEAAGGREERESAEQIGGREVPASVRTQAAPTGGGEPPAWMWDWNAVSTHERPAQRELRGAEVEAPLRGDTSASPGPTIPAHHSLPAPDARRAPAPSPTRNPWPTPPEPESPREMRQWREQQREEIRRPRQERKEEMRRVRKDHRAVRHTMETFASKPIEERIRLFRRSLVGNSATIATLATVNLLTFPFFPWFIFPAIPLTRDVVRKGETLWPHGVTWRQVLGLDTSLALPALQGEGSKALSSIDAAAAELVPREVLEGPHGSAVKRAVADRAAALALLETLSKADRELLPDVVPTVQALVERIVALAQMLHHLDADVRPELGERVEARIAEVEREPEGSPDRERRLMLLQRQRATLQDLTQRRARVAGQLDSAGIALQNLELDLLKLRSSGVHAAL